MIFLSLFVKRYEQMSIPSFAYQECFLLIGPPSDAVHGVENVHALHVYVHAQLFADLLHLVGDLAEIHLAAGQIHHHHHGEIAGQNGLGDLQYIHVAPGQSGGDAGDDAGAILAGDGDQRLDHGTYLFS